MILGNITLLTVQQTSAASTSVQLILTMPQETNSQPSNNSEILIPNQLIEVKTDSLIKYKKSNLIVETQILKTMSLAKVKWRHCKNKLNNMKMKLDNLNIKYKFQKRVKNQNNHPQKIYLANQRTKLNKVKNIGVINIIMFQINSIPKNKITPAMKAKSKT